jgi:hypothetical protein
VFTRNTLHRKRPCDGVDGSIERLAADASLQKPQDNQILTPLDLYSWAKEKFKSVHLKYIQFSEVEDTRVNLQSRFDVVQPIPGTIVIMHLFPLLRLLWW